MRHRLLVFGNVMVILALLMAAVGCAGETASPPPAATAAPASTAAPAAATPQSKEPIKIGFFGNFANTVGKSNKAALEISVDEVNKAGGILGRPVQLIAEDSKWQVPLAVAAYRKLVMSEECVAVVSEGVDGALACMEEGSALFTEYPHLQLGIYNGGDQSTDLVRNNYDKYKHYFQLHMRVGALFDDSVGFWSMFTDMLQTKKLALVCEDLSWTEPLVNGAPGKYPSLKEALEERGIEIVYEAKNASSEKMFLPMLEQIATSGADTIYWVTGATDTVTLAKQWAQSAAKDLNFVSMSGACSYASFWDMTGGAALGWVAMNPEIATPFTDKTAPFLEALKAKEAGLLASTYGAADIPWVVKAAVEKVGGTKDGAALIKAMETIEVQHNFWKWKFDETHHPLTGDPYFPMIHGQFQENGKFVVVHGEETRELTNPNDKYIPVKELRAKAGQ